LAEPCDPEVLHARLSVVEADSKRHDEDIGKMWGKVTTLEVCAACLPGIQDNLKSISSKVEDLTACALKSDSRREGQTLAYLTIREWVIVALAALAFYLDNIMVK
jgi:hypothetical protein